MKKEPKFQNQHKLPQVYLKQFGFEKDDSFWVSVLKVGTSKIQNIPISEFSAEINIFDLPFENDEIKRHYENLFNKVETRYRTILSNLKNQRKLIPKDKDYLNDFTANIICRTEPFRTFILELLKNKDTREKFIKEITMFSNDFNDTTNLLDIFKIDYQLNMSLGTVMNHLVSVFSSFEKIIIKEKNGTGWLTTNSPVFIDYKNNHSWIIPIEAEIYFPLSKDYCLFMFHPKSKNKENPLRKLKIDKINIIDFKLFDEISAKIISKDFREYLIMNREYENNTDLKKTTGNNV